MAEKKDDKDEIRRVEFILDEKELQFERSENKTLFDGLDVSPEAIMENPMNLMLSNFNNEYMKNERIGVVLYDALTDTLRRYQKMVNENYYYQNMDIVNIMNDLLMRYNTWLINQRGLILNTRDQVKEIKEMLDSEYITKKSLEKFQDEIKLQLAEEERLLEKSYFKALVHDINKTKTVEIPNECPIEPGEWVAYKKSKL